MRKGLPTMFSLRKLWSYSWGTIAHPTKTCEEIAAEGSLVYSAVLMVAFGVLYSIVALIAYLQGHQPSLPILIAVRPEKFYLVEAIYLTPLPLQFWLLFSALCHLFSGGKARRVTAAHSSLVCARSIWGHRSGALPDFISSV